MSLINQLLERGYKLQSEGRQNYRIVGHAGLIIKGNYWYSHSLGKGGNATTLLEMLKKISDLRGSVKYPSIPGTHHYITQNHCTVADPIYKLSTQARNYLSCRGIKSQLLDQLQQKKLLGENNRGYLSFIGYDDKGQVRCISHRAYSKFMRVKSFESKGSDKRFCFSIPAIQESSKCIIVEGPIDALSIACMENLKYNKGYFNSHILTSCGSNTSHLTTRLRQLRPTAIYLALDTDEVGQSITERLLRQFRNGSTPISVIIGVGGKDPNDWLMERLKSS